MERIADYSLVRSLGDSDHGQFFIALTPPRLGLQAEHVALRVYRAPQDEERFRRATAELRAFASASSPYLVRLYDAGHDGERFFYAMEYLTQGSLERPPRPLDRATTMRAVACAARAAHALHQVGVVHRAIRPSSILIAEDGATLSGPDLPQWNAVGQTVTGWGPLDAVEYMDPRLLRGERASRASDVWALGVTLHRVLAGRGVYGELSIGPPSVTVQSVLSQAPIISDGLRADEAELIAACLAADSSARPATAAVVAERIDQLVAAGAGST